MICSCSTQVPAQTRIVAPAGATLIADWIVL
jgi:hypothetical protein